MLVFYLLIGAELLPMLNNRMIWINVKINSRFEEGSCWPEESLGAKYRPGRSGRDEG